MMVNLRDYQGAARDAVLATWGEKPWYKEGDTFQSCVLNIPTSAGKTIVAGAVCESICKRGRFLYLADRDELCQQPLEKFARMLGINASLDKAGNKASLMADVVIGSVQTLCRDSRLERFPREHFSYIFVDEAHRSVEQASKIREYFSGAKSCGQTATAFRAKLKDLSNYYETVAFELGLFSLIDKGYIVPLKVLTLPVDVDISEVKQSQSFGEQDYDKEELTTRIEPVYRKVAELIREHAHNRQIVAFLPLIKSSQDFVSICRSVGIAARHIDHQSTDREQILKAFELRQFQLIACSTLLSTGWDCPPCDCLLNLTPTRSPGMWQQKVGRIGRVLPGVIDGLFHATERRAAIAMSDKPDALILDLLYHTEKFGVQGPADLVAANEKERTELAAKLAGGEFLDLEYVAKDLQKDREAELKRALKEAARRKAEGLVDAKYYAAVMRDRELADYEPTMKWHNADKSEKQVEFLLRNGIDPETVQDRGHASAIMTKIWARRDLGLAGMRTVMALDDANVPGATHYSEEQAFRFLGDKYPFPFGAPARKRATLGQITYGYWAWLADQPWVKEGFPIVYKYMQQKGLVREQPEVQTVE